MPLGVTYIMNGEHQNKKETDLFKLDQPLLSR